MELGLVQTHVTERQSSEQARQQHQDWYERREDSELPAMNLWFPLCESMEVLRGIFPRKAGQLAQTMCGEREQRVS